MNQFELILKLQQRLLRLVKLAETIHRNDDHNRKMFDLTGNIEESIRKLFNNSCSIEVFIQDIQKLLNVTMKSSLNTFLSETIPLAQEYLRQCQYDPYSWEIFKTITISNNIQSQSRLPSFQQACFRLPASCSNILQLNCSSTLSNEQADINHYQQNLIHRFAKHSLDLDQSGENLIVQTLFQYLKYIIRRLLFFTQHRIDMQMLNSNTYDMTNNTREQIRFLIELNKLKTGQLNYNDINQRKFDVINGLPMRNDRVSIIDDLRQKEADQTACFLLRECRLKRQKLSNNNDKFKFKPTIIRSTIQDLICVMENETNLRRSKTLLFAYANK